MKMSEDQESDRKSGVEVLEDGIEQASELSDISDFELPT